MEFEDILSQVGDFGKYQKILLVYFIFPTVFLVPWFTLNILFMISVPDHWCRVPELIVSNLSFVQKQFLTRVHTDDGPSQCQTYAVNYSQELTNIPFGGSNWTDIVTDLQKNWPIGACESGWEFDTTSFDETVSTKWNLFCSDGHYPSLILTLGYLGGIIGTPIYGILCDRIGRRKTYFILVCITVVSGVTSVIVPNFTMFVGIRIVCGSLMPVAFQLPYVIAVEMVGPAMRARINGIINITWTLGMCALPLVAYLSRDWIILGAVTSATSTLCFILYWRYLPESPRWLLSRERYDDAAKILTHMAKVNGRLNNLSPDLVSNLREVGHNLQSEKAKESNISPTVFFRYPKLRKNMLIITLCLTANVISYYGLQINVPNLDGNEFLNFFLLALMEIPGYLLSWLLMEKIGRRWSAVGSLMLTGIFCLLPVFCSGMADVAVAASLVAKFWSAVAFMTLYQQAAELYPTPVRSLGMGLSGTVAGTSVLALPYIVYLAEYGKFIPFVVFGGLCIIAGVSTAFLPETLNYNLPQTIPDAETFGNDQKFFSFVAKCKTNKCSKNPHLEKNGSAMHKPEQVELISTM